MRILVDGIAFERRHMRGIQRYARELFSRIAREHEVQVWLQNKPVVELPEKCSVHYGLPGKWSWAFRRRVKRKLRMLKSAGTWKTCDVFHTTFFSLPPLLSLPGVVTIHDLIPQRFPHVCENGDIQVKDCEEAMEAAKRYIAVSHSTAKDLAMFYPSARGRVRPICNGADHLLAQPPPAPPSPRGKYIMFVGYRGFYKNFRIVLEAMNRKDWPTGVELMIVGYPLTHSEHLLIDALGLRKRIEFAGGVSDEKLREFYLGATAVVVPSFAEGFGFPVFEAQSLRVPVVCSDIPVFRELAGESVIYFDPRLEESLVSAISRVMEPAVADRLRQIGPDNVRRFTWDQTAAATLAVYRELI